MKIHENSKDETQSIMSTHAHCEPVKTVVCPTPYAKTVANPHTDSPHQDSERPGFTLGLQQYAFFSNI